MFNSARIPTTSQLRTLEASWIKACHSNWGMVLMETAGAAAAAVAIELFLSPDSLEIHPDLSDQPVTIVCGTGNNGGDGLVVARHLARRGVPVHIHMVKSKSSSGKETEGTINRHIIEEAVGMTVSYIDEVPISEFADHLSDSVLIVDALLGTGLDRDVDGIYKEIIRIVNDSQVSVLAIDIPSGIHSDTGQIMGSAVAADATVTFGYLKAGLLHFPGAQHSGDITVVDIGLPSFSNLPEALQASSNEWQAPKWWLATARHVRQWLPFRAADGNKGTFGKLLCIAGSVGMTGSAVLASRTALKSGAGYSILATVKSVVPELPASEVVYRTLPQTDSGTIAKEAIETLSNDLSECSAVLLGPGISTNDGTVQFIEQLISRLEKPCILDADGLNVLAKLPNARFGNSNQLVITPHPKELERLIGVRVPDIQKDRIKAANLAVHKFGCSVVLKGAHTVVATPEDGTYIIPTGNPGMATAGAGDVLSGIIGAFLALGMPAPFAAVAGAYVHGAAGDLAAEALGEDGLVASDIMEAVPQVMAELRDGDLPGHPLEYQLVTP